MPDSANFVWRPIAPYLDTNGAFSVFSHLQDAAKYKPLPKPTEGKIDQSSGRDEVFTASSAVELGLAGIVSASISQKSWVIVRDIAVFREAKMQSDMWALGTRWGAGYRLSVVVHDLAAELSASLSMQKAALLAEGSQTTVSFEIQTFGFINPAALAKLPVTGRFDDMTLKALADAEAEIRQGLADALSTDVGAATLLADAVPFQVRARTLPSYEVDLVRAQSHLFACLRLHHGTPLERTLRRAEQRKLDTQVVRRVYAEAGIKDPKVYPSNEQGKTAETWLLAALPKKLIS